MKTKIINKLRNLYKKTMRLRLINKDFSLIASNCNGMFILKDLNLDYKSPFVNLWMHPKDFIKFLNNIDYYSNLNLTFITEKGINYPVGVLEDIKIYFLHYNSEEEAYSKWTRRIKRINKKNMFILMTDRDGCTEEDLLDFENLPFDNKKVLVHIKHPEISSSVYIPGFEDQDSVGMCYEYKNAFSIKRIYETFDYIKWFNNGVNKPSTLLKNRRLGF